VDTANTREINGKGDGKRILINKDVRWAYRFKIEGKNGHRSIGDIGGSQYRPYCPHDYL
jgi:hypothetical protein